MLGSARGRLARLLAIAAITAPLLSTGPVAVAVGESAHALQSEQSEQSEQAEQAEQAAATPAPPTLKRTPDPAGGSDSAVTVTQTNRAKYAWLPASKKLSTKPPTVVVSQTRNLTNQVVHVTWSNFTPSQIIGGASGAGYVAGSTAYAVGVFECRTAEPAVSPGSTTGSAPANSSCYPWSPGSPNADHGAGNAVRTFTGASGAGEADIQIETSVENDFLACTPTVRCSLAVVPQFGGAKTSTYSPSQCAVHSGDVRTPSTSATAVDTVIGDACSWADRLTVPLSFATSASACPSSATTFTSAGSPMLERAMAQWRPAWCTGASPVAFGFDSGINEYEARSSFVDTASGITSAVDVAFTTQPASAAQAAQRALTYAPVANTGVAIAFSIDDDVAGRQVTSLKLNARLVAKLLTQSYSLRWGSCPSPPVQSTSCDPGVVGNPDTVLHDPEFQALNPNYIHWALGTTSDQQIGQFLPTVVAGNSDLIYALTRWVASDPEAAKFLAGTPDPWGMHVNTYYENPGYPVSALVNQDPGYTVTGSAACSGNGTMQVAWGPVSGLDTVSNTLLANRSSAQSTTAVNDGSSPCHYPKASPEGIGKRVLFAVVDAGEAAAFRFPTASLENAAGAFVAPTAAGLAAGVANMTTNPDGITQQEDLAGTTAPAAYPLTVTDYAMVPTCKAPASTATAIGSMLRLASSSQTPGREPGDLYPGFVPLSAAQTAQTASAESLVAAQDTCSHPGTSPSAGSPGPGATGAAGGGAGGLAGLGGLGGPAGLSGLGGLGGPGGLAGLAGPASAGPAGSSAGPAPDVADPAAASAESGRKYGGVGRPAILVPLLIAGALLVLLAGPGGWLLVTADRLPGWTRRLLFRGPA